MNSRANLDKLEPYNPENKLFALVDAGKLGLGFILLQKDSEGRSSILQAGSTSLKHAQVRWNIPELELLAVKYMLNKCSHYTLWSAKPIIIYSNCSGLKQYKNRDISDIDNRRIALIKSDIMVFSYELRHIKGEANCIADCLSRRPTTTWLVGKDRKSDSNQDLILTQSADSRDEFCLRVITEA